MAAIDKDFMVSNKAKVPCYTKRGTWSVIRHDANERGDASSVAARQKSIEAIGLVQDRLGHHTPYVYFE